MYFVSKTWVIFQPAMFLISREFIGKNGWLQQGGSASIEFGILTVCAKHLWKFSAKVWATWLYVNPPCGLGWWKNTVVKRMFFSTREVTLGSRYVVVVCDIGVDQCLKVTGLRQPISDWNWNPYGVFGRVGGVFYDIQEDSQIGIPTKNLPLNRTVSGWCVFHAFSSLLGEMIQFDEHIFKQGWNHQLGFLEDFFKDSICSRLWTTPHLEHQKWEARKAKEL